MKLLNALDRRELQPQAVFTESGPIMEYARRLGVPTQVVRTQGAFFYSAHAQLGLALLASRSGDARDAAQLHGIADAIHEKLRTTARELEARLRQKAAQEGREPDAVAEDLLAVALDWDEIDSA